MTYIEMHFYLKKSEKISQHLVFITRVMLLSNRRLQYEHKVRNMCIVQLGLTNIHENYTKGRFGLTYLRLSTGMQLHLNAI